MSETSSLRARRTRARTYVLVLQDREGYPADSEPVAAEDAPQNPTCVAVVLLDDHERLEAENENLRGALRDVAAYAGEGPHQALGEACGIDACAGCLIHATAIGALEGGGVS